SRYVQIVQSLHEHGDQRPAHNENRRGYWPFEGEIEFTEIPGTSARIVEQGIRESPDQESFRCDQTDIAKPEFLTGRPAVWRQQEPGERRDHVAIPGKCSLPGKCSFRSIYKLPVNTDEMDRSNLTGF